MINFIYIIPDTIDTVANNWRTIFSRMTFTNWTFLRIMNKFLVIITPFNFILVIYLAKCKTQSIQYKPSRRTVLALANTWNLKVLFFWGRTAYIDMLSSMLFDTEKVLIQIFCIYASNILINYSFLYSYNWNWVLNLLECVHDYFLVCGWDKIFQFITVSFDSKTTIRSPDLLFAWFDDRNTFSNYCIFNKAWILSSSTFISGSFDNENRYRRMSVNSF